ASYEREASTNCSCFAALIQPQRGAIIQYAARMRGAALRRFPPPWTVEGIPGGYKVNDANGQSLAYVYGRETRADADAAHVLTMDEARRIASNIAKLPMSIRCLRLYIKYRAPRRTPVPFKHRSVSSLARTRPKQRTWIWLDWFLKRL